MGPLDPTPASLRNRNKTDIAVHANSDAPICYIMTCHEARQLAQKHLTGEAYWLNPPAYDRDEFREAWHRLESAVD